MIHCPYCDTPMLPGPIGGAAQNFYCMNRKTCRHGFNLTIIGGVVARVEDIGEVEDVLISMYSTGSAS